jgi:hypothetical protein
VLVIISDLHLTDGTSAAMYSVLVKRKQHGRDNHHPYR